MNHPELFQQMLQALNSYAAYNGNTTTGSQRIALAKAIEALYSNVEGCPTLSIQVDVSTSLKVPQKPQERQSKPVVREPEHPHTFDAIDSIKSLNPTGAVDEHTSLIAN